MTTDLEFIKSRLSKPVVIIGLMGAGKTKIGALLASALEIPFVDSDQEIEKAAGLSVAEIFEKHGEGNFRDLERRVLLRLLSDDIKVIATGGGAVMNNETADLVFGNSLSIWLRADIDVLIERTGRNDKRPLLKNGDPREIFENLIKKRYPTYARATLTVDSTSAEKEVTLQKLVKTLAEHLQKTA